DLDAADRAATEAHEAAAMSFDMPIVATVGLACAALAEHRGDPAGAAEMLRAAALLPGAEDLTNREIAGSVTRLRAALGEAAFEAASGRGLRTDREAAIARLPPAAAPLPV